MLSKLKIKYIQSLGQKKPRDEAGVFLAEGPKLIEELLTASSRNLTELYATETWAQANKHFAGNPSLTIIEESELERISQLSTPNQVLGVFKRYEQKEPADPLKEICLALDGIQDPGNLGTIIRVCDWFGIKHIICGTGTADMYNPKVIQSSMGSIARVQLIYQPLVSWLPQQQEARIFAAGLEGITLQDLGKVNAGVILIGNESKGISDEVREFANVRITIAKKGEAESLNAAIAAGIILSHIC